jgi:hypothetical protein
MPEEKKINTTEEMLLTSSSQEQVMKALQRFYKDATNIVLGEQSNYLLLLDRMADVYCSKGNDELWNLIHEAKETSFSLSLKKMDVLAEILVLIEEFYS